MRDIPAERIALLKTAIGKSEAEVRQIIRLHDGNVYRDEMDAILLRLWSTSPAFNEGVSDYFNGRAANRYCKTGAYTNHINWTTGYGSVELAVALHGIDAVHRSREAS